MQLQPWPPVAVALPGTGSDATFVDRAFRAALSQVGVATIAVDPTRDGWWAATATPWTARPTSRDDRRRGRVDRRGRRTRMGGRQSRPGSRRARGTAAWTGSPVGTPAAASAVFTASRLRADGLDAVTAEMTASSPPWLADELSRSWRSQWPDLPSALEEAASYHALDVETSRGCACRRHRGRCRRRRAPPRGGAAVGLGAAAADLVEVQLQAVGDDPSVLGRACLAALDRRIPTAGPV